MGWSSGNWLQGYREYTKESESPEAFHLWTGLSVLASTLRRNVVLDQGIYHLFPNMFVILVGPAGRVAKSTTIRLGRKLLLGVEDIIFTPDSLSREELIRQMAQAGSETGNATVTIHSSELSSLIDVSGVKMIQFLTDIYDGDFKWRYSTKNKGRDELPFPILNLLAGTTPSWLSNDFPAQVVGHGFTARTIFVYSQAPRFLNAFPASPSPEITEGLIADLNAIAELRGEFIWGKGAKDLYEDYYKEIDKNPPSDYRIESFHWRKRIHILKLAMLLSVSESSSLIIEKRDIETAWKVLKTVEGDLPRAFSNVGGYEHAEDLSRILDQIRSRGKLSITDIYSDNYSIGSPTEIADIIQMLVQMGKVEKVREDGKLFLLPMGD
jgi:hypothetical protein